MHNQWKIEDQRLPERLNEDIVAEPTLARPDPPLRFHIKTYWFKYGIRAVLLQADNSAKEINPEEKKRKAESVNLKYTWKEFTYYQFLSS